jgi:hypothetical protein
MKVSCILCMILACASLILEARAIASSEEGRSSAAAAKVRETTARAAPSLDAGAKPRRGSVASQGGVAQAGRSNADRLHSLLNTQARGRLARQPVRAGSTRAVTPGRNDVRGSQGVSLAGQPKSAAPNSAALSPARLPAPRNPVVGGPHAQGPGRVGGPAISRTSHSATVDGAQLHRKF